MLLYIGLLSIVKNVRKHRGTKSEAKLKEEMESLEKLLGGANFKMRENSSVYLYGIFCQDS